MTLTARYTGGEEARAFQRQQRRAQARWELQHVRPDWSVWESKAAEEGRWLRDRAQQQATNLSRRVRSTYDSDPVKEYAQWQGSTYPSDSDLDRLQGKVKAAADRVEEKRKRLVGRQRYFEGMNDLDPSGVLGRKVQNLHALTIKLQTARLARVAEDPQIKQAEGMQLGQMEQDPGEVLENDRWPLRHERPEAKPSDMANEHPAQESRSGAAYQWTAKAAAAFQEPNSEAGPLLSGQGAEPPKEQVVTLQPEARSNAVQQTPDQQQRSGQMAARGGAESDLLWPPMSQLAAKQAHEDSMSGRPDLVIETTSSGREGSADIAPSQLGYAPLPLPRPPKRASRAKAAQQRRSLGAGQAFDDWQGQGDLALPPPPPPPLRMSTRTLTKQEKNERFWLALRGERPASDLIRRKS